MNIFRRRGGTKPKEREAMSEVDEKIERMIRLKEYEKGISAQLKAVRDELKEIESELVLIVETAGGGEASSDDHVITVSYGQKFDTARAMAQYPIEKFPAAYTISRASLSSAVGSYTAGEYMSQNPKAGKINVRPIVPF